MFDPMAGPRRPRPRSLLIVCGIVVGLSGCAAADETDGGRSAETVDEVSTTTILRTTSTTAPTSTSTTTTTSTTVPPTTISTTSSSSTTNAPTTSAPAPTVTSTTVDDRSAPTETIEIGRSVEDRPILVHHHGEPGGVVVLVIGVIHGNEPAGYRIAEALLADPAPDGVELWIVPTMNPDGLAVGDRRNANGVDLNRNFPERWDVLGELGDWQYGGPAPASEPETKAMLDLADLVQPDLVLWYHQDLFRIHPASGRDGAVRERYADLTGLPLVAVTGGTYTGTASTWSRTITTSEGIGFTIELGAELDDDEVATHADAVRTVAIEMATGRL